MVHRRGSNGKTSRPGSKSLTIHCLAIGFVHLSVFGCFCEGEVNFIGDGGGVACGGSVDWLGEKKVCEVILMAACLA